MIRFACPRCNAVLEATDQMAGKKTSCLKCLQRLEIPVPPQTKTVLAPLVSAGPPAAGIPLGRRARPPRAKRVRRMGRRRRAYPT
jgi:hypothetical protein